MSLPIQELAKTLLRQVERLRPINFTGLGIVFYEHLNSLPFIALDASSTQQFLLPVIGLQDIASTLASVSSATSGWHDGFHFVDSRKRHLTHLAQFLSPALPQAGELAPHASGARHMTALLASKVKGIDGIGLLTYGSELAFYEQGAQTLRVTIK